jgi:hypothetical protein
MLKVSKSLKKPTVTGLVDAIPVRGGEVQGMAAVTYSLRSLWRHRKNQALRTGFASIREGRQQPKRLFGTSSACNYGITGRMDG